MKKVLIVVLMVLSCSAVLAQTRVTGRVTSSQDGSPIPFASVVVKGTMTGVASNENGAYVLDNVPSNAVLVFSSIGFNDLEVMVSGRSVIDAALTPNAESLEETIVVAYGTAKKGTYTGAASVVKQESIKDVPTVSFEQALNGKVAGMQITSSSGQAGSASSIRIRGIGSMNASNEPLYVIDGVPAQSGDAGQMSDYIYSTNNVMNSLNPSDIESITVLKDAAASALYGSRAANGVILVTTKKGKEGRPTVTFKASVGITPDWAVKNFEPASVYDNVNALYTIFHDAGTRVDGLDVASASSDAVRMLNSRWNRFGYKLSATGTGAYDPIKIEALDDGQIKRTDANGNLIFFDWMNAYFRTAVYQTYDLSVSGGTKNSNYYTSFAYTKDQGRVYINGFDRISGRVNLNQKVGKHFELTTNVAVASTDRTGFNDTINNSDNYFMQSVNLLWPLYWPDNYKDGTPWTSRYQSYGYNLLYYNNLWENSSKSLKISVNETATVKFTDWLNLRTVFSYDDTRYRDHLYYSPEHYSGASDNGRVSEMSTIYQKLVSSTTLNFNKSFGDHGVSALVGFEAERNTTDFHRSTGKDLPVSALHTVATAGSLDANGYSWGNSMMSILSRLEYNYAGKYYASASFRRDGSSRLGADTRWGNFWSVAASWRISEEEFFKSQDVVDNLRLRASYGVNGTLPSSNYGWRSLAGYSYQYMGSPGGALVNAADANLSWETSYTYNLALEFGLFNSRLTGSVEYFNRDSKDLLQDVPISTTTGFGSTLQNIGEINNHGFEVELGGDIIRNNNFRWSASVNASFIRSKVTKLYDDADIIWYDPTGGDGNTQFLYRVGESTLAIYGREWAGTNPENGDNLWYSNNDNCDMKINGRNVVLDFNDTDEVILGDVNPFAYGGINTDLEWNGLTFGLNFIYKLGGKIYDGSVYRLADDGYFWNRIRSKEYLANVWTPTNHNGIYPQLRGCDLEDAMEYSSRWMHDGTFLRLKTISLGYNLPTNLIKKVGLDKARVYFNGSNLLTFSKYTWADPEVNAYGSRAFETPIGKTYTFGIELSF